MIAISFIFLFGLIHSQLVEAGVPESLDWRSKGVVTKPKNQGSCAAGWAFAIIGLIEGAYAKKYGLLDFSAQELLDCVYECNGCGFCDASTALQSLQELGGLMEEADYPYVAAKQQCHFKQALSRLRITDMRAHYPKDEICLKRLLAESGPLYVAIDGTGLETYNNGILKSCPYKRKNHAVLLVGYGSENGQDYWIIKNSKGLIWGENGYARIRRGINACGLLNSAIYEVSVEK